MKKIINANAEAFIVPNAAGRLNLQYSFARKHLETAKINGISEKEAVEEKYVELWFSSDELHSENIGDHGCSFDEDGRRYYIRYIRTLIPVSLLKGHKEGEIIPIKLAGSCEMSRDINKDVHDKEYKNEDLDVELQLNVKLNQLDYRYRRFGTFEQCLQYVL
jgi:hypothetical protein